MFDRILWLFLNEHKQKRKKYESEKLTELPFDLWVINWS